MTLTSQQLREQRTEAGLSLRFVAHRMGISAPHLLDLERGYRTLSPALGCAFAKALKQKPKVTRPGLEKVESFKRHFPHALRNNEWRVKWPIKHRDGATYNPDLFSPALGSYIEVCTSWTNYSEAREKWQDAIKAGYKLRVYWWTGAEITAEVVANAMPSDVRAKHNLERD